MRYKSVLGNLGLVLAMFSTMFIVPFVTSLGYDEGMGFAGKVYLVPFATTLVIALLMLYYGREELHRIREREAFALAGFLWLTMAALGAMPYLLSGALTNGVDAYFESMSGFVTCGNTVISDVESIPHSVLMWRSLTQWIGGVGIIVLAVALMARVLGRSMLLFKAEVPGHKITRLKPTLKDTAVRLWGIYIFFTVLCFVLLIAAGMPGFDAINHSFTALAGGGFSVKNASIGAYGSPLIEAIVIFFMIVSSTSFFLHYELFKGNFRKVFEDPELRVYLLLLLVFTLIITIDLSLNSVYSPVESFRHAAFQSVSMHGTVGFTTVNVGASSASPWPMSSQFLLVIMMLIGGSSGSTCGALKVVRPMVLVKSVHNGLRRIQHPRAVSPVKIGGQVIPEKTVQNMGVFVFLYLAFFLIGTMVLLFTDLDLPTAASASASALGNVGSGIAGATGSYAFISPVGKVALTLLMWLGRLEIFAAIIIFFPSLYKEK